MRRDDDLARDQAVEVYESLARDPSPSGRSAHQSDPLQARADEIAAADRAEEANQFFSAMLCYAKNSPPGIGVHLTLNGRKTLCDLDVKDEPTIPRTVEALSCQTCHDADYAR